MATDRRGLRGMLSADSLSQMPCSGSHLCQGTEYCMYSTRPYRGPDTYNIFRKFRIPKGGASRLCYMIH